MSSKRQTEGDGAVAQKVAEEVGIGSLLLAYPVVEHTQRAKLRVYRPGDFGEARAGRQLGGQGYVVGLINAADRRGRAARFKVPEFAQRERAPECRRLNGKTQQALLVL